MKRNHVKIIKRPQQFDYKDNPAWRMFRIMGEFTDGFEFISKLKKAVTIFGSARTHPNDHWYKEAEKLGHLLSRHGCNVVTGGGPGIMEAANKGAFGDTAGDSVGLNIELPKEQRINPYVERGMPFHYFFTRKVCMTFSANAFVYFPGGFGTLDEFFEILTLVQTKKIIDIPVVVVGKKFWKPFLKAMKEQMYDEHKLIDAKDMNLITVVDNANEAFKFLKRRIHIKG